MTTCELLKRITEILRQSGIENARTEARWMISHVLNIDSAQLSPVSSAVISSDAEEQVNAFVQRRIQGEPLQYLLGRWEFMGLPFLVDGRALIPRADTEILCEAALRLINERGYHSVLDLCCGTGCIGISLAKLGGASVMLADISTDSLALCKENADLNGVSVSMLKSDLFSALEGQTFDLICCNPPYLTEEDMLHLQKEVRYEPALALYGGADGLDFYRRISEGYQQFLRPNGAILLEIGCEQAEDVAAMFQTEMILKDYAGHPRVVFAEAK